MRVVILSHPAFLLCFQVIGYVAGFRMGKLYSRTFFFSSGVVFSLFGKLK